MSNTLKKMINHCTRIKELTQVERYNHGLKDNIAIMLVYTNKNLSTLKGI